MSENNCNSLPSSVKTIHKRIDKVEDNLNEEILKRRETNKIIFEKFDKLNSMIMYQLFAAILTLITVFAVYLKG